jgi:hypothetical protein
MRRVGIALTVVGAVLVVAGSAAVGAVCGGELCTIGAIAGGSAAGLGAVMLVPGAVLWSLGARRLAAAATPRLAPSLAPAPPGSVGGGLGLSFP